MDENFADAVSLYVAGVPDVDMTIDVPKFDSGAAVTNLTVHFMAHILTMDHWQTKIIAHIAVNRSTKLNTNWRERDIWPWKRNP